MAYIQKRINKNGEISYIAQIRISGYGSEYKTFKLKTDAKEWAQKTESEIRENINFPKRKAQKYTIAQIIDKFIENELPKRTPKEQSAFINALNWYKKEIGEYYLSSLTTEMLVNCREKLMRKHKEIPMRNKSIKKLAPKMSEKKLAPATINKYMTYMRVVFAYCVNDLDILDINPMAKVKKLTEKNARKRYLELKEIAKLLNTCKSVNYELYLCVLIALLTGARKSEILHLTWATVDFENKMLYFLNTKNGTDRGTPMHELVYKELMEFKTKNKVRCLKNDFLFKTPDGKPKESLIGKLFPKIVKKCGIKDFRFHDIRHTHASYQAMGGISQKITQETLGHKTTQMTNRYSHLRDENLRPAINQIGNTILKEFVKVQ